MNTEDCYTEMMMMMTMMTLTARDDLQPASAAEYFQT